MLLLANTAATGTENKQLVKIRKFLDNLNKVSSDKEKDVKTSQEAIKESMKDQEKSEIEYWDDWHNEIHDVIKKTFVWAARQAKVADQAAPGELSLEEQRLCTESPHYGHQG